MSRLLLNTRVTLGINFCPSRTNGLAVSSRSLALDRVIERVLQIDALAAQHHGADGDSLLLFVQVGNDERGLIRPDSPRFVIARQKLDGVFSGKNREAGVVFNRPLGQFDCRGVAQLDIHLVAHVGDRSCRSCP